MKVDNSLLTDIIAVWFKYNLKKIQLWVALVLVTIPLASVIAVYEFEQRFVSPSFAAINDLTSVNQIYISDSSVNSPVDEVILNEIINESDSIKYISERSLNLPISIANWNYDEVGLVSFFSGGYKSLGISPSRGSLKSMEFPHKGNDLVAAITHHFWVNSLKSADVLSKPINVNGKTLRIVAVLPPEFTSFRKGNRVDIVIPYTFKNTVIGNDTFTPDTLTYLLGDYHHVNSIVEDITPKLQELFFIFDDNKLNLINAFGITPDEYISTSKRINLLRFIFLLLLIYCLIAFIAFEIGEMNTKQKEYELRRMCGASRLEITVQRLIESALLSFLISIVSLVMKPLITSLIFDDLDLEITSFLIIIGLFYSLVIFITFFLILNCVSFVQSKYIQPSLGRSDSLTKSERFQAYALLSKMIGITVLTVFVTLSAIISQYQLSKVNYGFKANQKWLVDLATVNNTNQRFELSNIPQILPFELAKEQSIRSVALSSAPPLTNKRSYSEWFTVEGVSVGATKQTSTATHRVTPPYFDTMETRLLMGKSLAIKQYEHIVVNQTLWNKYFRGKSLSEAFLLRKSGSNSKKYKIVGVVEDIKYEGPDSTQFPVVYELMWALSGFESIVIDSASNELDEEKVSSILRAIDSNFKIKSINSLEQLVDDEARARKQLVLLTVIIAIAILCSSLIFCSSYIAQIIRKLSLEVSLRSTFGASKRKLFIQICAPFLFWCAVVSSFLYLTMKFIYQNLWHNSALNLMEGGALMYGTVFVVMSIITGLIFYYKVEINLRKAWDNLS